MANKNIQMKKKTGGLWENLYPVSLAQNIVDSNGITVESTLSNLTNKTNTIVNALYPPNGLSPMVGDDATNNTTQYDALVDYMTTIGGGVLYIPKGKYRFNSRPTKPLKEGTTIQGDGLINTHLIKNYIESTPTNALITVGLNNNCGGVKGVAVLNEASGGTGISFIAVQDYAPDFCSLHELYISGGTLWDYPLYVDGSARSNSPIGVRNLMISNCQIFQGALSVGYFKSVTNLCVVNTGFYTTGGGTSFIHIVGSPSVATNNVTMTLSFCDGIKIGVDDTTINHVCISCPVIINVENGANVNYCSIVGNVTNKQYNWASGNYVSPSGSDFTNGITNRKGSITSKYENGGNTIGYVGQKGLLALNNGIEAVITLSNSAKLFDIDVGGGQGALCFCDYVTSAITLLSNPSNKYVNSSAPSSGMIGIYKDANSHEVKIKNNTGGLVNIGMCVFGSPVTSMGLY